MKNRECVEAEDSGNKTELEECDCGSCSCGKNDNFLDQIQYLVDTLLTDEQRVELLSNYCGHCGKIYDKENGCCGDIFYNKK